MSGKKVFSETLLKAAREEARKNGRSVRKQLRHWTTLGRYAEDISDNHPNMHKMDILDDIIRSIREVEAGQFSVYEFDDDGNMIEIDAEEFKKRTAKIQVSEKKIFNEMMDGVRNEAQKNGRSLEKQINHWIRIGRFVEHLVDDHPDIKNFDFLRNTIESLRELEAGKVAPYEFGPNNPDNSDKPKGPKGP